MIKTVVETPITLLNYSSNSNQFYIKRDDLIPFSFGGNKVRIAEEYFNDMQSKDCDCIISYGSSKSNLNRVIANMSRVEDVPCYIVTTEDINFETRATCNSILVKNTGANIISCSKDNIADTIENVINKCEKDGMKPYYVNGDKYGKGNEETSVRAYIKAYKEIVEYEKNAGIKFDYIFHASGTGMTQAGLICGKMISGNNKKIIGISIARNYEIGAKAIEDSIYSYFKESTLQDVDSDITFIDRYVCGGYGKYNNCIISTIQSVFNTEGIALDTTYTGKAFWGMTEYIKENGIYNKNILFIHTGGSPLFFDDLLNERLLID